MLALAAEMVATAAPAYAQTVEWIRQFGSAAHDIGDAVSADAAGNIYVSGLTDGALPTQTSAGNFDAFLARYDASGAVIWYRQFGTGAEDGIRANATDSAGNIYVAGFIGGATTTGGMGLVAKYDSAGTQLWLRQFGPSGFSTQAIDVDTDAAGNVYVLSRSANIFGGESFLSKYTPTGEQSWSHPISAPLEPLALATDLLGHVYLVGRTNNNADAFLAQYDALGNQVWLRQFGTASNDIPQDVTTNALGDVYVIGLQDGYDLEASWIAQYDAAGNQNWMRSFTADSLAPWAMAVTADDQGNAFIGGFVWGTFAGEATAGRFDAFVLQYDRAGTQGWVRLFGTPETEDVRGIAVDLAGNMYVAGTTHGAFPGETHLGIGDVFLARLALPQVGSGDHIADLRATLASTGIGEGILRSLEAPLAAAQRAADAGNLGATCGPLAAFASEVAAQDGKKLTAAQATLLRSAVSAALAAAGCNGG
jgi:hypothetical protein